MDPSLSDKPHVPEVSFGGAAARRLSGAEVNAGAGIRLRAVEPLSPGAEVLFTIRLQHAYPGESVTLACRGEVVEIADQGGTFDLAATIKSFRFE
jgi:hypothetical protein